MASNTSRIPFQTFKPTSTPPSSASTSFTLTTPSNAATDIWRKPANPSSPSLIETFNAPIIYKSIPLSTFRRVRVTISAAWDTLYDQGGLVLVLPSTPSSSSSPSHDPESHHHPRKWIKTGIEFYQGEPYIGTVSCDRFADWSLTREGISREGKVTMEMERDGKEGTLWVYVVREGERRVPVRENTWFLAEEGGGGEVWVGVYAATPMRGEKAGLEVVFEGWELSVCK